jgi:tetratricopeptide (TPR) repeat protein
MRARRQRLIDGARGQQSAAIDVRRGGIVGWLREHILASILGAALVATATGWFSGFFDSVLHESLPSGAEAFCALRETVEYRWPFARKQATRDRFSILIATIDRDDSDHTYTRAVARAFLKRDDIDRIETCRVLRLPDVSRDAEISAVATARSWLTQQHADLLIAGEMLKKDEAVSLWFIDKDPKHDWRASTFHLDANLLKQDFFEAASTQLLAVVLSSIRPATEQNRRYVMAELKPIVERLRHLLEFTSGFTATQKADIESALGITLSAIGDQAGDNVALTHAVTAFRAAVAGRMRDRAPLAWAMSQKGLGTALARLGDRQSGTALLEEAVVAYRAALEELPPDRVPLAWAMAQMNLGNTLKMLGGGQSGTAHLEEAVAAFRAALQELPRDRVPLDWAMNQTNLGNVLATLGERESGTAHLEEAVAAYRAALEEEPRDRVPLAWALTQANLATALRALESRESRTAHLEEAVAAYRAVLEEEPRDRVPLAWAITQMNLGTVLATLGERESGTARLEEAVTAFTAALEERTRDRVPLEWAQSTGNQGVVLMLLAERLSDATKARTAVQNIESASVTMRVAGVTSAVPYYEAQLRKARALFDRLTNQ